MTPEQHATQMKPLVEMLQELQQDPGSDLELAPVAHMMQLGLIEIHLRAILDELRQLNADTGILGS